ncbi:MAG: hypothetical protein ACRECV_04375, partial [Xanthobacteraceae bacterium]
HFPSRRRERSHMLLNRPHFARRPFHKDLVDNPGLYSDDFVGNSLQRQYWVSRKLKQAHYGTPCPEEIETLIRPWSNDSRKLPQRFASYNSI